MVIKILDYVPNCYSRESGEKIYRKLIDEPGQVFLSFSGCNSTTSSFVNAALIQLLKNFDFNQIKEKVKIIDSNTQINNMIKKRFTFEVEKRGAYEEKLKNI